MDSARNIQNSIHQWVHALSALEGGGHEVSTPADTVLALADDSLDGPGETEWFRFDGRRFGILLNDDFSTLRLTNTLIAQDVHGGRDCSLVSWFGYRADHYELRLHPSERGPAEPVPEADRLTWFGWDCRFFRTHLMDGSRLSTATPAIGDRATWMGWDGENLDIFTGDCPPFSATAVAVLVGKDDSVLEVHRAAARAD